MGAKAVVAGVGLAALMTGMSLVERGRYLTVVGGCADCHSPKIFTPQQGAYPDASRHLAGHVAAQPLPEMPPATMGPNGWGALVSNDFTAWAGPWGISFASNLTPDTATGLGTWTEEMFIQTLREGRHQGTGRPLLPPMPWQNYREMTDEDLRAMFMYLKSIPAMNNVVPDPVPPVGNTALPQTTPVPPAAPGSTQPR